MVGSFYFLSSYLDDEDDGFYLSRRTFFPIHAGLRRLN